LRRGGRRGKKLETGLDFSNIFYAENSPKNVGESWNFTGKKV
jgi:hypothetical protein